MKDQYFGDVNDYCKYGLLRVIAISTELKIGICWMLTPSDSTTHGGKRGYLGNAKMASFDPELYKKLKSLEGVVPLSVGLARTNAIIPNTSYYDAILDDEGTVKDRLQQRTRYFTEALQRLAGCEMLFYDPDNGIEIKSVQKGQKKSNKYIYWDEVKQAIDINHSVLVYQHFPRESHKSFEKKIAEKGIHVLGCSGVFIFSTSDAFYALFTAARDRNVLQVAADRLRVKWAGKISVSIY